MVGQRLEPVIGQPTGTAWTVQSQRGAPQLHSFVVFRCVPPQSSAVVIATATENRVKVIATTRRATSNGRIARHRVPGMRSRMWRRSGGGSDIVQPFASAQVA